MIIKQTKEEKKENMHCSWVKYVGWWREKMVVSEE